MEEIRLGAMRALAWGEEGAPPVLALHGWLDNAASFIPLARHLSGVRLVALDAPGHGRSAHYPPGRPYHLLDSVFDVLEAADHLGWRRFCLLGHSLGGAVSLFTALAASERVERLALIEGLAPISRPEGEGAERLRRAVEQHRAPEKERHLMASLEVALRARRRAGGLSEAAARLLVERGCEAVEGGYLWRHDPRLQLGSLNYLSEAQVLAYLKALRTETLLIAAEEGLLLHRTGAERRIAAVENLRLERLPGGHHLHMEQPEAVAARLAPYLARSET